MHGKTGYTLPRTSPRAKPYIPARATIPRTNQSVLSTAASLRCAPERSLPPRGAPGFIDQAVGAVSEADTALAELQDSMLPVEAGDPELRAGLTEVRERVRGLPGKARELLRTLGR